MLKLLSFLPSLFAIIRRGKTLATLAQSKTTKAQYTAILIAGVLLAAVGYFVPAVADNDVAVALIVLIAPIVSRLLLFKGKFVDTSNDMIMLDRVQYKDDAHDWWEPWADTILSARELGYARGTDAAGNVYDIETGTKTGEVRTFGREDIGSGPLKDLFVDKFGTQDSTSGATVSGVSLPVSNGRESTRNAD